MQMLTHFFPPIPFAADVEVDEYFSYFVEMIKSVLDGNLDGNQFEDTLREMFGIHAYIGFTMDKVVQNICRQLQHLACDETCSSCTEMFLDEMKSTAGQATGGTIESQAARSLHEGNYQKNAEKLLQDENCYKIMFFKSEGKVTIELLDTESPESEAEIGRWSAYVDKYVRDDETVTEELKERLSQKPVFLPRNIANWRKKCTIGNQEDDNNEKSRSNSQQSQDNNNMTGSSSVNHVKDNNNDHGDEKMETDSSQEKSADVQNSGSGDVTAESDVHPNDNSSDNNNKPADLSLKDVVMHDSEQCRFNVNSYKMLYIIDGESYIYRKNSLKNAKAVSTTSSHVK
jgi:paired amphipathic helix protein Sin3a